MPNNSGAAQVALLTPLPLPDGPPPPSLTSGTVALFQNNDWNSQALYISIDEHRSNERETIPSALFDQATWAAFNLPVGVVMTLMDNIVDPPSGNNADMSGGMNDIVSSYFWRTVDLDMGAIEMFRDSSFQGTRSTLFLSEWPEGQWLSISDWWAQDQISSLRWQSLNDRQTAVFKDNADGTGNQFADIQGYLQPKEISWLGDVGFNDAASSFRWDGINPVKEIIKQFDISTKNIKSASGVTASHDDTNDSSLADTFVLSIDNETAQSVTTTAMDQHVVGVTATYTSTAKGELDGIGSEVSWSVGLKYEYTHSDTKSNTQTQTIALNISETIQAPPHHETHASMTVSIGKIPATTYHTTAERWYDVPVTGGKADPANHGWYKRVEDVTVSIEGSLAVSSTVMKHSTPIKGHGNRGD